MLEFVKAEFPILLSVFEDPEIVLLVRVSVLDAVIPAYPNEVHAVEPSPTLNFLVSVSNPISPAAKTVLAEVQEDADPLLT
jgi:hypothetical protein